MVPPALILRMITSAPVPLDLLEETAAQVSQLSESVIIKNALLLEPSNRAIKSSLISSEVAVFLNCFFFFFCFVLLSFDAA